MLTSYHTLFMRNHNFVAKKLARFNPQWDDEELYQKARYTGTIIVERIS